MSAPADEEWKIIICARDIMRAQETLAHVEYMAAGGFHGRNTDEERLAYLRSLTGAQIADAIEATIKDRRQSVSQALGKEKA